ncbi:hypothetical protein QH639_05045 [Lysinibacillus sp. 1 U-2021]|uniref:hypothetical protein n=1 Tax=Lysinibacillus sp. 1 U-2021 TaxID=3039426 RepID=UPI00247FE12F|nr:hypothetical protein [Lysinibacillus sp. 1 U-2021]WGT40152.1 hypothetical protein QH639_05045 [Lysinibacillus sp. 1 U-2021]
MPTVAKRLYKGTAGTTSTTAYTVPAGTTTIVKNIVLTNKTTSSATITVIMAGTEIVYQYDVTAKNTVTIDISTVMNATETITLIAGMASAVNVYISGVEVN